MRYLFLIIAFCSLLIAKAQNNVIWDYSTGVSQTNNTLIKTNNNGWGNAGAVSGNILKASDNGWAEFTVSAPGQRTAFGFIKEQKKYTNDAEYELESFQFAIVLHTNNKIRIYKNGEQVGQYGNYNVNDVLRIEKAGNTIYFKKNGVTYTQLNVSQTKDYRIKASLYNQNGKLLNPKASFIKPLSATYESSNAFCTELNRGSINLTVSGGVQPYSYQWSNGQVSEDLSNIDNGIYTLNVNDNSNQSISKDITVLSCVKWQNTKGIQQNGSIIKKTASNLWGNAGAYSLNLLKYNENGFIQYVIDNQTDYFAFGFDVPDTLTPDNFTKIKHAFVCINKTLYISSYGKIMVSIGRTKKDDLLKIAKIEDRFEFYKNDVLLFKTENKDKSSDFRIETALYKKNSELIDIKASFFRPKFELDFFKQDISVDEPNTGLVDLISKYGLTPYSYQWNTGSTESAIYDQPAGDYVVTAKDALGTIIEKKFTIGQKVGWANVKNISFEDDQLIRINSGEKAGAKSSKYIDSNADGWYEFKIAKLSDEFSFALREFTLSEQSKENVYASVSQKVISMDAVAASANTRINRLDSIPVNDSVRVLQKEFVDVRASEIVKLGNLQGVQFQKERMFVLFDGKTIEKPFSVKENDVIRIGRKANSFYISVNSKIVFNQNVNPFNKMIGEISLTSDRVAIRDLTSLATIPVRIPLLICPNDVNKNWSAITRYDGSGNIISESKDFFDYMGRPTQSLAKNISQENVIAMQILYDAYGRAVLQTLPAPIFETELCYKNFFITNYSGTNYTFNDFDRPDLSFNSGSGEVNNPAYVSPLTMGSLGWYYGQNNSVEPYVATSVTPYTRMEYNSFNPSDIKKYSGAGRRLNSGSGHETYEFTMTTLGELNYLFGYGASWTINDLTNAFTGNDYSGTVNTDYYPNSGEVTFKQISKDENGVESVEFFDLKGNLIASCLAGQDNGANVKTQNVQGFLKPLDETKRYIDVHLPQGCESSLILYQNAGNQYVYNIYDLKTGNAIKFTGNENFNGIDPALPAGFYRIALKSWPVNSLSSIPVKQKLNYYNISLNYYDRANRLVMSIPPQGIDDSYVLAPQVSHISNSSMFYKVDNSLTYSAGYIHPNWSLSTASAVSEIPITIPLQTSGAIQLTNILASLTFKKDWTVVSQTVDGTNVERVANEFYTSSNFAEPMTILDANDFAPTNYDTTGAAYHTIPGDGDGEDCYPEQIFPVVVTYRVIDQNGQVIPSIGNGSFDIQVNLNCEVIVCPSGTSYNLIIPSTPSVHYLAPGSTVSSARMKILDVKIGGTSPYYTAKTDLINLLKANITAATHMLPAPPQHKMQTANQYNTWSELLTSYSPDGGKTDYVYSKDGTLRYTQNSKQDASNATPASRNFNYTNYDILKRPVERGEFNPTSTGTGAPANTYFENYVENALNTNPNSVVNKSETPLIDNVRTRERVFLSYDSPDASFYSLTGLSSNDYKQEFLMGEVSCSYNSSKKTWYSYDELGRTTWMVQRYDNVNGSGTFTIKTFNYKYDFTGNVLEIDYQKENAAESFYHYYEYDADKHLKRVYTSRDGIARQEEAEYSYYLHGALKRVELANKLQGLDYVHTIDGWLKSINAAEMDGIRDAGKDGLANSPHMVPKDLFGLTLDYFDKDYEKQATYIQTYPETQPSTSPDLFNGTIKAQRWQTKTPSAATGLTYQNQHLLYAYKYDKKYQLKEANFGTWSGNSEQNFPIGEMISNDATLTFDMTNDYRIFNLDYDYNGNIKMLTRNAYTGGIGGINLDKLTYTYKPNSNQLDKVADLVPLNQYNNLGFKPFQANNNYIYNELGELIQDTKENKKYEYNSDGLVTRITNLTGAPIVEYEYDGDGQRIYKRSYSGVNVTTTFYVRDGSGIAAIYEKTTAAPSFQVKEWNIYGASRLGTAYNTGATNPEYAYEINDHLGNVRTTFKPITVSSISTNYDGNGTYDHILSGYNFDNTVDVSGGTGNSVKTSYPFTQFGASMHKIPVKNGQVINITFYSKHNSSVAPTAMMAALLVDKNDNVLAGANWWTGPISGVGGTWNQVTFPVTITENYPDMYINVFPWNLDPSGDPAWFDNLQIQFVGGTPGGIPMPEQLSAVNYYPHGSVMPGMNYNSTLGGRYGYQGQYAEMDKEINEQFFELRNYNPLLGRFNSVDPVGQYHSPYMAMGNSHPNSVDPDGGNALSAVIGGVSGAATGFAVAAYLDYNDNGKFNMRDNWALYTGWSLAGAAVGAISGGLSFDADITSKGTSRGLYRNHRSGGTKITFSGRGASHGGKLGGLDGLPFRLSKRPWKGFNTHFSFGIRVCNWVLLDIRFNSRNNNNYQINFPGRWNLHPNSHFRFSMLYFVWPTNKGHYHMFSDSVHWWGCFFGGYTWFRQDPGVDPNGNPTLQDHKGQLPPRNK